jgi:hypothetical protein
MKRLTLLGATALLLATLAPQEADAQQGRRGIGGPGQRGAIARGVRGPGYAYRGGYRGGYRRGGRGWGPAVGVGVLGLGILGAAAAANSYGYADPCLQQQEVYDPWGRIVVRTVRVC